MDSAPRPIPDSRRAELTTLVRSLLTVDLRTRADVFHDVDENIDALFELDLQWCTPLLTPNGLDTLSRLLKCNPALASSFRHHLDATHLMRLCLSLQSIIAAHPARAENALHLVAAFSRPLFHAILHYLHPDQAEALNQLRASLPTPLPPMPRSHVPPAALPLLFPTLDTTQFAPAFDSFMYSLTQYSAVNSMEYNNQLSCLLDTIAEPNPPRALLPGVSIDQALVHNNLLNSYDEYLHYMLPSILPQLHQNQSSSQAEQLGQTARDATRDDGTTRPLHQPTQPSTQPPPTSPTRPTSTSPLLFPYFPTPHPILAPISTPDAFSALLTNPTDDFVDYFLSIFVLDRLITDSPHILQPASFNTRASPLLPFNFRIFIHNYRAWHLKTAPPSPAEETSTATTTPHSNIDSATHTNPITAINIDVDPPSPSHPPHLPHLSPPDLATNPTALLQLTLVPLLTDDFRLSLQPHHHPVDRFKPVLAQLAQLTQQHCEVLVHLIEHCFPTKPARDALVEELAIMLFPLPAYAQGPGVRLSHALYRRGYTTLHQHAYRLLLHPPQPQQPQHRQNHTQHLSNDAQQQQQQQSATLESVHAFLSLPLIFYHWGQFQWADLTNHITLCVHAGFLTPFPPSLPTTTPPLATPPLSSPIPPPDHNKPHHHSSADSTQLYHRLLAFRAVLLGLLVRLTGFLAYFPHSTRLLAGAVSTTGLLIDLVPPDLTFTAFPPTHDIPLCPPLALPPDPRDSTPNLQSALVDDDGKLFAVTYAPPTREEPVLSDDETDLPFWPSLFSFQDAPRHQHVFRDAAMEDIRVCIAWEPYLLATDPALGVDHGVDPRHRSRISAHDLAWIESDKNDMAMKLSATRTLQKQLTAYYGEIRQAETRLVIAQLQTVMAKMEQVTLTSTSSLHHGDADNLSGYPFTDLSHSPNFSVVKGGHRMHDKTFSKPRGVLFRNPDDHTNFFYDHNYRATQVDTIGLAPVPKIATNSPQDQPLLQHDDTNVTAQDVFDANGQVVAEGTFSMLEHFRQRSEWALELLIVGCLGPQLSPSMSQSAMGLSSSVPASTSAAHPSNATPPLQRRNDHLLARLPALLSSLSSQPQGDPTSGTNNTPTAFYHDTLSHLALLSILPLYHTLASLLDSPHEHATATPASIDQ